MMKVKRLLIALAPFFLSLFCAHSLAADEYDVVKGRGLAEFQIFDAYQMKTTDLKLQKEVGHLIFLYRELLNCGPLDQCRRLALAWLSPDGRVVELEVSEEELTSSMVVRQKFGNGFGSGNNFNVYVPDSVRTTIGPTLDIRTSGSNGVELFLSSPRIFIHFERVFSAEKPTTTIKDLNLKLANQNYYPVTLPELDRRTFTLFANQGEHLGWWDGVLISRPEQSRLSKDWQLVYFTISQAPDGFSSAVAFNSPFVGLNQTTRSGAQLMNLDSRNRSLVHHTPPIEVKPILNQVQLQSQPSSEIPGAGSIWPAKAKQFLSVEMKDPLGSHPPKVTEYRPLEDNRIAEYVVQEFVRLQRKILSENPPFTPFIRMLVGNAAACQLILSAPLPEPAPRRRPHPLHQLHSGNNPNPP